MNQISEKLANILEYPDASWQLRLEECRQALAESRSDQQTAFAIFREKLAELSLDELQEKYTQSFDLNPVAALEVGYHLFGENYKRGEFLASLTENLCECNIDRANQLPDYLPLMMRLVSRLGDDELRCDLISQAMLPAIEKMIEALSRKENPYRDAMVIVSRILKSEVPNAIIPTAPLTLRDAHAVPGMTAGVQIAKW